MSIEHVRDLIWALYGGPKRPTVGGVDEAAEDAIKILTSDKFKYKEKEVRRVVREVARPGMATEQILVEVFKRIGGAR